jgi:hypothetical protein
MNQEDFAIVVGISRYPGLGDSPEAANLQAPDRDAKLVYNWLNNKNGGAVPKKNIQLITSSQFPIAKLARDAEPTTATINECFRIYLDKAQANQAAGTGTRVGRRLYIYVSGHGFSPKRYHGALYTATATKIATEHVYVSDWVEWLQDTGYFDEFVLWMDCCMEREFTVVSQATSFRQQGGSQAPGPTFIGLAAPRPLKTVEREISGDKNQIHGVFTWALLNGLKGAAVNQDGLITGPSLETHLLNTMKDYLAPQDAENSAVAKEPDIVKADRNLIFISPKVKVRSIEPLSVRPIPIPGGSSSYFYSIPGGERGIEIPIPIELPTYSVKLLLPKKALGCAACLWTGTEITEFPVSTTKIRLNLERGLYAIEVPDVNLQQGFEVTGSGAIAISVTQEGERSIHRETDPKSFDLEINTGEPTAEIFIIDRFFELTDRGVGSLRVNKPFGIYKVKIRLGRDTTEQIVLLDRDRLDLQLKLPQLASAAPLAGSALIHEYHEAAAQGISQHVDISVGSGGQLSLMVRSWGDAERDEPTVLPWQGIEVIDAAGQTIANLADSGRQDRQGDPMVVCNLELDPGTYYLRRRLRDNRIVEQSAIVSAGWRTELFLLKLAGVGKIASCDRHRLSIFMHQIGQDRLDDDRDRMIDAARIALTDGRHILTDEMKQMFLKKCDNPIAGMIGSHLLLMEHDRQTNANPKYSLNLLDIAVANLRRLVGENHPDIEALSLRCLDPDLHTKQPFSSPPMLVFSWQLMVQASKNNPQLIPFQLWEKVRANVDFSSYFAWASDRDSRQLNQQQLATWIESLQRGSPLASTDSDSATRGIKPEQLSQIEARLFDRASGLSVPANALAKLWHDRSQ